MKQNFVITSITNKIDLPVAKLVKNITGRNSETKYQIADIAIPGYEAIVWHFANIPVKGELEIVFSDRSHRTTRVNIPASTAFLGACMQTAAGKYIMSFGTSLS